MIDQKLQRFFTEFERAIGEHDFEKLGALYADSFISAGPSGNAIRTRADLLAQARNASTFYESVGQTSLKILSMQQTPITECYSLVKVSWGATFRATGDRVGMMIKLADTEQGAVNLDGTVTKSLTPVDCERLETAKVEAKEIMKASGVTGPFVDGMIHGGHLGGTVPLTEDDVETMHPSSLPQDLWVADLSLMPRSQGLPTMLTAAALSARVASKIAEEKAN